MPAMTHKSKISKQGNDLVVKLPVEMLDHLGLKQDDTVSLELHNGHIQIAPLEVDYNEAAYRGRESATLYRTVLGKGVK